MREVWAVGERGRGPKPTPYHPSQSRWRGHDGEPTDDMFFVPPTRTWNERSQMLDILCAIHGEKIDETEAPERNQSTITTYPCQKCIDEAIHAVLAKREDIDG